MRAAEFGKSLSAARKEWISNSLEYLQDRCEGNPIRLWYYTEAARALAVRQLYFSRPGRAKPSEEKMGHLNEQVRALGVLIELGRAFLDDEDEKEETAEELVYKADEWWEIYLHHGGWTGEGDLLAIGDEDMDSSGSDSPSEMMMMRHGSAIGPSVGGPVGGGENGGLQVLQLLPGFVPTAL